MCAKRPTTSKLRRRRLILQHSSRCTTKRGPSPETIFQSLLTGRQAWQDRPGLCAYIRGTRLARALAWLYVFVRPSQALVGSHQRRLASVLMELEVVTHLPCIMNGHTPLAKYWNMIHTRGTNVTIHSHFHASIDPLYS